MNIICFKSRNFEQWRNNVIKYIRRIFLTFEYVIRKINTKNR